MKDRSRPLMDGFFVLLRVSLTEKQRQSHVELLGSGCVYPPKTCTQSMAVCKHQGKTCPQICPSLLIS